MGGVIALVRETPATGRVLVVSSPRALRGSPTLLVAATSDHCVINADPAEPIPSTVRNEYASACRTHLGYITRARDRREVTLLLALHSEVDVRRAFQLDVHHVRSPSLTAAAISLPSCQAHNLASAS